MDFGVSSTKYSPLSSAKYNISIQADLGGYCFCIKHHNKLLSVKAEHSTLNSIDKNNTKTIDQDLLLNQPLLDQPYKSQFWIVPNTFSTLIPFSLFDPKQIQIFGHKVLGDLVEGVSYDYDVIEKLNAIHLYSRPISTLDIIRQKYPTIQTLHPLTKWMEYVLKVSKNHRNQHLYIDVSDTQMAVLCAQKGQLSFYNQYIIDTDYSVLYYLLAIAQKFKLVPNKTQIHLFSQGYKDQTEIINTIANYFKVEIYEPAYPSFTKQHNLQPYLHLIHPYI